MKILMTTDTVGGVWTYSLELARALQGRDVHVLLAVKGPLSGQQRAAARALDNVDLRQRHGKLEWMDDPWNDVAEAGDWLLGVADGLQPDIVHLNDYCHAALPWKVPVLVVGHSCVLSWFAAVRGCEAGAEWDRYRVEVCRGLRAADLVVAPTASMLSALDRYYGPLPSQRVIFNGCDANRYWRMGKQSFVFSAGRFWDEAKNLATLAVAASRLRWPVGVAGLRHPEGKVGRLPDDGGLEAVEWLGQLTPDEMTTAYAVASIYALPALYEPFGLTALEAALSGCALVLGDIPTLREVWGDAACYVAPRDADGLAATINRLIDDVAMRKQLAQRASGRGRQLSAERMAAAYCDAYRRLAVRHRQAMFV
jgi:glycogen synthase